MLHFSQSLTCLLSCPLLPGGGRSMKAVKQVKWSRSKGSPGKRCAALSFATETRWAPLQLSVCPSVCTSLDLHARTCSHSNPHATQHVARAGLYSGANSCVVAELMKSDVTKHNMSLLNWLLFYCHCKKGSLQVHFQPSTNHSTVSIFWHWILFTVAPEAISLLCMCDTYCRTDSKATVDLEYWRVFTVLKSHRTTFLLKITVSIHFLFLLLTQCTWYRTVPLMLC